MTQAFESPLTLKLRKFDLVGARGWDMVGRVKMLRFYKLVMLTVMVTSLWCSCASPRMKSAPPAELKIVSRTGWNANPPVREMVRHRPRRLTIHHTATLQKPDRSLTDKLLSLQKFSQNSGTLGDGRTKPAWPDVPYHFYIDAHGQIGEGRDINYVGDTNTEYDPTGHVLVVLEGNFEEEQVTEAQWTSLCQLSRWLIDRYSMNVRELKSHKDYAQTLCPGENLYARLSELREWLKAN